MVTMHDPSADSGEESLVILQSLICLLREKNILSRADIEELCDKVARGAKGIGTVPAPLPCCPESARAASENMQRLTNYIGQRYGGKHARRM